jgi:hypothetical protein
LAGGECIGKQDRGYSAAEQRTGRHGRSLIVEDKQTCYQGEQVLRWHREWRRTTMRGKQDCHDKQHWVARAAVMGGLHNVVNSRGLLNICLLPCCLVALLPCCLFLLGSLFPRVPPFFPFSPPFFPSHVIDIPLGFALMIDLCITAMTSIRKGMDYGDGWCFLGLLIGSVDSD